MSAGLPPGPPGAPLLGHLLPFRRDPLGFLMEVASYGDVVPYRLGRQVTLMVRHPDAIKDVLVTHQHDFQKGLGVAWARLFLGNGLLTSEGAYHTRQRRLAQPAFHRQRIGRYAEVMAEHTVRFRDRVRPGAALSIDREMMGLTLAIAAKTLFDTGVEAETAEIGASLTTIVEMFPRFALPFAGTIQRLPLPSNRRFDEARARLDGFVYGLIQARRQDPRDHGDLLSMLMLAVDTEGDGQGMSDLQLRDEVMTLLLAGHETTANALTWTLVLLAGHPEVDARVGAEIATVLGDRVPTVEDLPRLAFTERVLAEAMRIYPPAWGIGRRCIHEREIGGIRIPAGMLVGLHPWVVHRDPRFWPEPERFDPDRFLPEAKAARPRFAYFPFGGGVRQCIGEGFAWMEGVIVLATLLQRFRFRFAAEGGPGGVVPGYPVEPQALITLRPRHAVRMVAEPR